MRVATRRGVMGGWLTAVFAATVAGCLGDGDDDTEPVQLWIDGAPDDIVIEATPVTDRELAEALSVSMTSTERDLAEQISTDGAVRESAEGPEVRDEVPFVFHDEVITFDVTAVGTDLGYRSVVSLTPSPDADLDPDTAPPAEVIRDTELPPIDRDQLFRQPDWAVGDLPGEVRVGVSYSRQEADRSVIAPNAEVSIIEWVDTWAVLEVHSTEVLSLTIYEYDIEVLDDAADIGRELRETHLIELDADDAAVAEVMDAAVTEEGYQVDVEEEVAPPAATFLEVVDAGPALPPYFHVDDLEPEGPSGRYLVAYGDDIYLLNVMLDDRGGGISLSG